jgi:hypothetical protein
MQKDLPVSNAVARAANEAYESNAIRSPTLNIASPHDVTLSFLLRLLPIGLILAYFVCAIAFLVYFLRCLAHLSIYSLAIVWLFFSFASPSSLRHTSAKSMSQCL